MIAQSISGDRCEPHEKTPIIKERVLSPSIQTSIDNALEFINLSINNLRARKEDEIRIEGLKAVQFWTTSRKANVHTFYSILSWITLSTARTTKWIAMSMKRKSRA